MTSEPFHDRTPPPVAVVVATRDRPALLARAVAAIVGQSYPGEVECLVVFDRSAPEAVPAPPDMPARHRRVRVLTNTRAPGLAGARNTGILASTAPLVAFCDDDDVWTAGKLSLQVERLRAAGPAAHFVASGVRIHHGDRAAERIPPPSVGLDQLVRSRVSALHPSTFLFRRDLLDTTGLVDEALPGSYGEDYDWLIRAARIGPVLAVQQPLVDVYWHEQSFFAQRWETVAQALEYLLAKHPELRGDRRGAARIRGQIAFARAALAQRGQAVAASSRALRGNPFERRAYLALAVAAGVLPATSIVRLANSRGRGI